jgi:hypothetical protein
MQVPLTVPLGVLKLQLSPDLADLQTVSASAGGPLRPPSPDWAIDAEQASKVPSAAAEIRPRVSVRVVERIRGLRVEMERMIKTSLIG